MEWSCCQTTGQGRRAPVPAGAPERSRVYRSQPGGIAGDVTRRGSRRDGAWRGAWGLARGGRRAAAMGTLLGAALALGIMPGASADALRRLRSAVLAGNGAAAGYGSVQRQDTPNDPEYDQAEPDTQQPPAQRSSNFYAERFDLFGFPSQLTPNAVYAAGPNAGKPQVAGFNAAGAWKAERGRTDAVVAILDDGIDWGERGLRDQIHLNTGELPYPEHADGSSCGAYDCNGDGVVNVEDYNDDPRVSLSWPGRGGPAGLITAQDLLHAFGDCRIEADHALGACTPGQHFDNDGNGFANDIAGWNFFDNTNEPDRHLQLLRRAPPRHRTAPRRRRAGQRRPGLDRRLPALPGDADPDLGHVRLRRQRLRARDRLRDRQRRQGARGRERQPLSLGLRRGRLAVRLRPRRRADLLGRRPQHRRPQLPGRLRPRDADPGHGPGHRRARRRIEQWVEAERLCGVLGTPGLPRLQRPGRDVLPRRQHDAVRRQELDRDGGADRLGQHEQGRRRGRRSSSAPGSTTASRCARTRRASCSSRRPSACSRRNTAGAGVADPGADPTLPRDEQWTTHFGWGRADVGAAVGAVAQRRHPARGGDRLARLVRAADRLERRRSRASPARASPTAGASTGS